MGNCLVTKLKEIVNNDELVRLGSMRLFCKKQATITYEMQQALQIRVSSDVTIYPKGNGKVSPTFAGLVTNPLDSYTVTPQMELTVLYFTNDDYTVELTNKYGITHLGTPWFSGGDDLQYTRVVHADTAELSYCTSLKWIDFNHGEIDGDVANLPKGILTNVSSPNSGLYGEIDKIELSSEQGVLVSLNMYNLPNLRGDFGILLQRYKFSGMSLHDTMVEGDIASLINSPSIENVDLDKTKVSGNLSVFDNFTSLRNAKMSESLVAGDIMYFGGNPNLTLLYLNNTNVEGTLEALIERLVSSGKTSGSTTVQVTGANVTLHGQVMVSEASKYSCHFSSGSCTIKGFNTGNTLATYDGSTWTYNS